MSQRCEAKNCGRAPKWRLSITLRAEPIDAVLCAECAAGMFSCQSVAGTFLPYSPERDERPQPTRH